MVRLELQTSAEPIGTVVRGATVDGKPSGRLKPWVAWYQAILGERVDRSMRLRFTAGACAFIVVPVSPGLVWLGPGGRGGDLGEAALFGPRTTWVDLRYRPGITLLLANLELGGLSRLLGSRVDSLVDSHAPLRDLGAPEFEAAAEVFERGSARAGGTEGSGPFAASLAFGALDSALAGRMLREAPERPTRTERLLEGLYGEEHTTRVSILADELGMTARRLSGHTMKGLGMSPKEFLGVSRAKRFLESLIRPAPGKGRSAADGALSLDYYDQAHAIHDIVRRTGLTPGLIAARVAAAEEGGLWHRWRE